MGHYTRPLLILAVACVLLVAGLLLAPHPKAPEASRSPLAPIEAIQKANDAAAASAAANAQLQAAGAAVGAP